MLPSLSSLLQVQRCLSVSPVTYWMATLIWDTAVSLVFVTIAAIIIQAFQVIAIAHIIISIIMGNFPPDKVSHSSALMLSAGAELHLWSQLSCQPSPHASLLPGEVTTILG